jgi:2-keto-4-pentenoate hydratase
VAGQPIAVPVTRGERYALLDALERMQVQLTNDKGELLASGKGSDILGQPLNAVVWIAQALQKEDITLQPGDLISLGSFSPLLPPRAGLGVTATYIGLPGAQPVQVQFK